MTNTIGQGSLAGHEFVSSRPCCIHLYTRALPCVNLFMYHRLSACNYVHVQCTTHVWRRVHARSSNLRSDWMRLHTVCGMIIAVVSCLQAGPVSKLAKKTTKDVLAGAIAHVLWHSWVTQRRLEYNVAYSPLPIHSTLLVVRFRHPLRCRNARKLEATTCRLQDTVHDASPEWENALEQVLPIWCVC